MYQYESDELTKAYHGDNLPSGTLYEAEIEKEIIISVKGNYPQLIDYEREWIKFALDIYEAGTPVELEYETVEINPTNTVYNAIPFTYKEAILKGSTKYRDMDTGELLDTFDETKTLELVSVKMPVLTTTGKNLLPCKTIYNNSSFSGLTVNTENNRVRVSGTATGICDIEFFNINTMSDDEYIKVKPNTKYILSATLHSGSISGNLNIACKSITDDGTIRWLGSTFTTNSNESKVNRIRIAVPLGFVFNDAVISLQLEESTVATSYEPYKSNILTVNEEVELRQVGTLQDELNLLTGSLTKRVGKIVLNGTENWVTNNFNSTNTECQIFSTTIPDKTNNWRLLCDKFNFNGIDVAQVANVEGICSGGNPISLFINISKTKASTVEEFKTWLTMNHAIIYYELNETVQTVELSSKPRPYEGTNHYEVSSQTIPPIGTLQVPVVSTGAKTLNEITMEG